MIYSRPLFIVSITVFLGILSVQNTHAALVLPLSQEEVVTYKDSMHEKSLYIQTPDSREYLLETEDIEKSLSVDTSFGESFSSSIVHLDTSNLLKATANKHQLESLITQTSLLTLQESASGVLIPEDYSGSGYAVSEELLEHMLLAQIFSDDSKLSKVVITIPVRPLEPKVLLQTTTGTQEELSIVAHGVSDYSGSSDARIHNIETGMKRFQGVRINPRETFSFNDLLGDVDGSTGYKKELVIMGDRTIPDYGGGICQVSSTVYRAALRAGFPIVERKPHSYAVSYYTPWGSDATIYPGVVDLRFENNFAAPVYLHLYTEGSVLHTLLYGTDDGRTVEMSGPTTYAFQRTPEPKIEYVTTLAPGRRVWKDQSHRGFSAYWDRTITSSTGSSMTERIVSTYEARGGFVLEGKAVEVPLQSE